MKVMFICTGNICRSAMADAMFSKMAKEQNKHIEVCSSGVYAQNGDVSTDEAIITMKEYGIDLNNHRATNIRNSKVKDMDVILCATTSHKNSVLNMYPELNNKVFTMKEYAGYPQYNIDIQDPWGYGIDVYKKCAKEIKQCLDIIIEKI